ncbi:MAG: sigma-54 dependent transcriptional regulator [Pseudomonadota bacterium]
MASILVVDDDEDILVASRLLLQRQSHDVVTCADPAEIPSCLDAYALDAVLLDLNFRPGESSGHEGMSWLKQIQSSDPDLSVIAMTAHADMEIAIEALKSGASDFVNKPWQNERMLATLSSAIELTRSRREANQLRLSNRVLSEAVSSPAENVVSASAEMEEVLSMVARVAPSDANVLILGENGTGKELIAREVHRQSARANGVFLAVDLGAVSESLFEAELFGHRKGAFTGARSDRPGRFQAAAGGTLFLDEVGNLPVHLQAKLLRVLQERQITPLGSDRAEPIDVRIVAATSVSPDMLNDPDHFRPDLLFRLNTVEIMIPPLRERRADILPVAKHFLAVNLHKYRQGPMVFSHDAELAMLDYDWPGNVRALQHAVERAVILAKQDVLEPEDLQLKHSAARPAEPVASADTVSLEQLEKNAIHEALCRNGFNISHTAQELGLTRASLYRRMEKHGL